MLNLKKTKAFGGLTASVLIASLCVGCATTAPQPERQERVTKRDRTAKGAGLGAAAGAAAAVLKGKRGEASEIVEAIFKLLSEEKA